MNHWLTKFIAKNPVINSKRKKLKKANTTIKSNKKKNNSYGI